MLDVVIDETAQHMDDGIDLTDVAEELVAEPFALGRAAHQPGDVDEGELGFDNLLRSGDLGQRIESRIGDCDLTDVRFDRAERIVGSLRRLRLRQRVEQGRFADIGQADDTAFETHYSAFCLDRGAGSGHAALARRLAWRSRRVNSLPPYSMSGGTS